jgi:hypothetical protein
MGDVVTIGPYEVELKSNDAMTAKDQRSDTSTNLELTSVTRLSPAAALTGKLQEVPLTEVLQQIEFNKKTGTLTVVADRQQGTLVVTDGRPVHARWGDLRDEEAVLRMLALLRGRFTFSGGAEPGERTMRSTLTGLLLEASRRIDEGETAPSDHGARADGPAGAVDAADVPGSVGPLDGIEQTDVAIRAPDLGGPPEGPGGPDEAAPQDG